MKNKINTAVILAAGMGTRLVDIIGNKPKGLLRIAGQELILHSLENLKRFGIENIILVAGYEEKQIINKLQDNYPDIKYLTNEIYEKTGSMHSLFLTEGEINTDFLLLESDIYYEKRALSSLLNLDKPDGVLISGKTCSGDEVYIFGENDQINHISKIVDEEREIQGELVGISKISLKLFQEMCRFYTENISIPANYHYEDCFSDISKRQKLDYLKIDDLAWTEIDDPTHYQRAMDIIVPKVQSNDLKFFG